MVNAKWWAMVNLALDANLQYRNVGKGVGLDPIVTLMPKSEYVLTE